MRGMMTMKRLGMLWCLVAGSAACAGELREEEEAVAVSTAAVVAQQTFNELKLQLPANLRPEEVALGSLNSLSVRNGAQVRTAKGTPGRVANSGSGVLEVSASAKVGPAVSSGPIWVRSSAVVDGDATSAGLIDVQQGASIVGIEREYTSVSPMREWKWKPRLPIGAAVNASLEPSQAATLQPGVFGDTYIKQNATLTLGPGTYRFAGLSFETDSVLELQSSLEPTIIYVDNNFTFRGRILRPAGGVNSTVPLFVVALGGTVAIDRPFVGSVFAPNGRISLGSGTHQGNYFGADVELQPYAVVESHPFLWSRVIPSGRLDFHRSPIEIDAWKDLSSGGQDNPSEVTLTSPATFSLPKRIWVRKGNAGNGELKFEFRDGSGPVVACLYKGAASVPHPTTDRDRALGLEYRFVSCSDGTTLGQSVTATWAKATVLSGDNLAMVPSVDVQLGLGGGCSDILDPDLSPFEVTVMREEFNWKQAKPLPLIDPAGRPAIWHALIYVESKKQLAALDRLKIMWSTMPLSSSYIEPWQGRCGRVEHSSDGKGIVVYALIPAKAFNILMTYGIQAANAGVAPPFKFIIPSTPTEAGAANSDGSLTYQTLAQSGYLQWLQARSAASPWFGSDLWNAASDWVSEAASDTWDWIEGAGEDVLDAGEDTIDYP